MCFFQALEPQISATIMELHHDKHHKTYVKNLNEAMEEQSKLYDAGDVQSQIDLQSKIKFNGGGHINHSLFWKNLAPADSEEAKGGDEVKGAIAQNWGCFEAFQGNFTEALNGIQGSGWGWLVKNDDGSLHIETTQNQDPITHGVPLLGVDFWEHAYYLQYYNDKASYIDSVYQVINWDVVEQRWNGSAEKLEL